MNDNEPTQVFSITTSWPARKGIIFPPPPPVFPGGNAGRRARKQRARRLALLSIALQAATDSFVRSGKEDAAP